MQLSKMKVKLMSWNSSTQRLTFGLCLPRLFYIFILTYKNAYIESYYIHYFVTCFFYLIISFHISKYPFIT